MSDLPGSHSKSLDSPDPASEATLRVWVAPDVGGPHEVDLTSFSLGGFRQHQPMRLRAAWRGDHIGRPALAREFADYLIASRPKEDDVKSLTHAMRVLCRFLDEIGHPADLDSSSFTDAQGVLFKRWVDEHGFGRSAYNRGKTVVDALRTAKGGRSLMWPARDNVVLGPVEDVDYPGVRRLFHAFKAEARSIKLMFTEGQALMSSGRDPRGRVGESGSAAWDRRENHAWLVGTLTRKILLKREQFQLEGGKGLHGANNALTQQHDGPDYLAPGMSERGRQGIVGKLRWFHPSYQDTAVFLWLFLLGTGWNLSTALSLDVTTDGWSTPHPQKPEFRVLHAYKARAGREQFCLSLVKPEWHPYQIVRFMIERTRVLRATVGHELDRLQAEAGRLPPPDIARRIAELQATLKSPWLYHSVNHTGRVSAFHHTDSAHLNEVARAVVDWAGLLDEHPTLGDIGTSDARDAWIGHAYVQSGYDVLMTQLASQHSSPATLRHYLRQKRFRAHSEGQVRAFQNAAFGDIADGRPLDATRLKILVTKGEITPEQEQRLSDLRKRTRVGMGCLDPTHPPREVAPEHVEGRLCRVQRCTGCRHGVVFEDSMAPLARALAELRHMQRRMPLASWSGSSMEAEAASLEATLGMFDPASVQAETAMWSERLKQGEVIAHDTYPSY